MTHSETEIAPGVHWNFFLGFLAALIAIAVGGLGTFAASTWYHAWGNPAFYGGLFGLGKLPFYAASVAYPALFVIQVVFTVRLLQHEADAKVYTPGVVGSAAVTLAAILLVPTLLFVYIYTFGG
jgi:hypothetical protein